MEVFLVNGVMKLAKLAIFSVPGERKKHYQVGDEVCGFLFVKAIPFKKYEWNTSKEQ